MATSSPLGPRIRCIDQIVLTAYTVGVKVSHQGPVMVCSSGLHASRDIHHAYSFTGNIDRDQNLRDLLCRVSLTGRYDYHKNYYKNIFDADKISAEEHTVLWTINHEQFMAFATKLAEPIVFDAAEWLFLPEIVRDYIRAPDPAILRYVRVELASLNRCGIPLRGMDMSMDLMAAMVMARRDSNRIEDLKHYAFNVVRTYVDLRGGNSIHASVGNFIKMIPAIQKYREILGQPPHTEYDVNKLLLDEFEQFQKRKAKPE